MSQPLGNLGQARVIPSGAGAQEFKRLGGCHDTKVDFLSVMLLGNCAVTGREEDAAAWRIRLEEVNDVRIPDIVEHDQGGLTAQQVAEIVLAGFQCAVEFGVIAQAPPICAMRGTSSLASRPISNQKMPSGKAACTTSSQQSAAASTLLPLPPMPRSTVSAIWRLPLSPTTARRNGQAHRDD